MKHIVILKMFGTRLKHQDFFLISFCHMRILDTVSSEMQMQIGCECTISLFILNGRSC